MKNLIAKFKLGTFALSLSVFATFIFAPLSAFAYCGSSPNITTEQWIQANDMVSRSESRFLRENLYLDSMCRIRTALHNNGEPCLQGMGNNHVTVDELGTPGGERVGPAYHVFDYTNPVRPDYLCTTRLVPNPPLVPQGLNQLNP